MLLLDIETIRIRPSAYATQLARLCVADPSLISFLIRAVAAAMPSVATDGVVALMHALPLSKYAPPEFTLRDMGYLATCRLPQSMDAAGFVQAFVASPFPGIVLCLRVIW